MVSAFAPNSSATSSIAILRGSESEDHDRFSVQPACHALLHPIALKREAVRLVESGSQGIERTARDLGISKSSLTRWMSDIREKDLLSGPHDDAQKELDRLRRENELLRAERDLLKKAAAYFAKETSR